MSITSQPGFLRTVLNVDAATCVATGLLMTLGGNFLSGITQIPSSLLTAAGLSLFPVAAFILLVATRTSIPSTGVWSVVLGNIAWVLASLWLLFGSQTGANGLGLTFIAMQAIAVAALAELEIIASANRRTPRSKTNFYFSANTDEAHYHVSNGHVSNGAGISRTSQ